jgi:D-3-phosphoglycerate dehydrogenase
MSTSNFVILQTHHPWVGPFAERDQLYSIETEALAEHGLTLTIVGESPDDVPDDVLRSADAVLRRGWTFPRALLEHMPACKIISCPGIGVEGIDLQAASELGIVVANVPYATAEEVGNHAITLLLAAVRKLVRADRAVRSGNYDWRIAQPVYSIRGKTLGFVAFGNSARSAAEKMRTFGVKMLAYDPYVAQSAADAYGVQMVELYDLLERSDFVSVHAPHNSQTHHLLDAVAIQKMKPGAILIQVSRGGIVDQTALAQALQDGRLAAAGIDVHEKEPPDPDHPLLKLDNVIHTPHYAGYSEEAFREQKRLACQMIARVLEGYWPSWVLNPSVKPKQPLRAYPEDTSR